jgi:hypothetical protein
MADPAHLTQTLGDQLGVTVTADEASFDALVRHLGCSAWLVVLDNCEHVAADCAALLERLLPIVPNLHVLATSRTALGLAGESVVVMRTMSLPAAAENDLAVLLRSESVEFFLRRARAAVPTFLPTPANAVAIREICRRLDGIPMAWELAAARVRVMSVAQIHERVDRRAARELRKRLLVAVAGGAMAGGAVVDEGERPVAMVGARAQRLRHGGMHERPFGVVEIHRLVGLGVGARRGRPDAAACVTTAPAVTVEAGTIWKCGQDRNSMSSTLYCPIIPVGVIASRRADSGWVA